ncbi:uncharacterized protein BO97DRAFT_272940 [Aspergillus homomorphus CBS 101889]|uniref:Uncharacterized protein n=1 Tax=Aspergillus homomorphus (strain CBS 101889) TaxID=1450537 RepID=A0A395I4Q7_ASPHC|nr:hypothetical protein BO97DRAFT_272940 [Aspergillus homomorphus CBS 101889]RAL14563.1 hypothetical protein BO97DRAFT_272940 [Aspergillus homomorphus CBS 101889]
MGSNSHHQGTWSLIGSFARSRSCSQARCVWRLQRPGAEQRPGCALRLDKPSLNPQGHWTRSMDLVLYILHFTPSKVDPLSRDICMEATIDAARRRYFIHFNHLRCLRSRESRLMCLLSEGFRSANTRTVTGVLPTLRIGGLRTYGTNLPVFIRGWQLSF